MRFRYWWQEFLLAGLAALSVLASGMLVISSLRLHMADMKWQLLKSEFLDGNMSKQYLVARFVDQYRLYQDKLSRREVDEREYRFNAIFRIDDQADWNLLNAQGRVDWISRQIINALRQSTGKMPLADQEEVQGFGWLERGFQLERTHDYAEALRYFDRLYRQSKDPRLLGIVELHQGFCLALLGNIPLARNHYESVIRKHSRDDLGVTATLLLRHLEILLQERELVAKAGLNDLERARKMTALLQCKEVLASFDPEKLESAAVRAEVLLLRAQCEEEVGDRNKAVENYSAAIRSAGPGPLAQDANRRLYMMGSQVEDGRQLRSLAHAMNATLQDESLQSMESMDSVLGPSIPPSHEPGVPTREQPSQGVLQTLQTTAQGISKTALVPMENPVEHNQKAVAEPVQSVPALPPLPEPGTKVQVSLQNGKTFVGRLLSTNAESSLRLQTMIGEIQIDPGQIESIIPQ